MKTCEQIIEALPALAEEVLDGAEAAEIRAHTAGCAECAAAWKRQVLIGRHFRETDLAVRPDFVWLRMRKSILDQSGLGTQRILTSARPRRRALGLAIAGVAASLLVVGALALLNSGGGASRTGIVRETPKAPQNKPGPSPEDPAPAPLVGNDGKMEDITPPKDEVADKSQDPPAPPPAPPEKKDEVGKTPPPEPKKGPIPQDPPKKDDKDTVAKDPKDAPKDPPASPPEAPLELAKVLPGQPLYPLKLAEEQAAILLPKGTDSDVPVLKRDSIEQVLAILRVARARLEEIRDLPADRKSDLPELVEAYSVLVGEGAAVIMVRMDRAKMSLSPADAELRAHTRILEDFPAEMRRTIQPALIICDAARDAARGRRALRHTPSTRARAAGALVSAREAVGLLAKGDIGFRTARGFTLVNRQQEDLLRNAQSGRKAEAEIAYQGYEKLLKSMVLMVECLDPKDAPAACALASGELGRQVKQFRSSVTPPEMRELIGKAIGLAFDNRKRVDEIGSRIADRTPKKDEKPPEKKPDPPPPPKDPPPPAPPFGEKEPPPSPPPPQPPFGEDPPK